MSAQIEELKLADIQKLRPIDDIFFEVIADLLFLKNDLYTYRFFCWTYRT